MASAMECKAFQSGKCTAGDACLFSHTLGQNSAALTIGARAVFLGERSDTRSDGEGSGSCSGRSRNSRSWADQSEDFWPGTNTDPSSGNQTQSSSRSSQWRWPEAGNRPSVLQPGDLLPSFNDRFAYPEFIPSAVDSRDAGAAPPKQRTKSAKRRHQRENASKKTGMAVINCSISDQVVEMLTALKPLPNALFVKHREYPRREEESPQRPPAPASSPRIKFDASGKWHLEEPDEPGDSEGDRPGDREDAFKLSL